MTVFFGVYCVGGAPRVWDCRSIQSLYKRGKSLVCVAGSRSDLFRLGVTDSVHNFHGQNFMVQPGGRGCLVLWLNNVMWLFKIVIITLKICLLCRQCLDMFLHCFSFVVDYWGLIDHDTLLVVISPIPVVLTVPLDS